jgi:hypothetical protein
MGAHLRRAERQAKPLKGSLAMQGSSELSDI